MTNHRGDADQSHTCSAARLYHLTQIVPESLTSSWSGQEPFVCSCIDLRAPLASRCGVEEGKFLLLVATTRLWGGLRRLLIITLSACVHVCVWAPHAVGPCSGLKVPVALCEMVCAECWHMLYSSRKGSQFLAVLRAVLDSFLTWKITAI